MAEVFPLIALILCNKNTKLRHDIMKLWKSTTPTRSLKDNHPSTHLWQALPLSFRGLKLLLARTTKIHLFNHYIYGLTLYDYGAVWLNHTAVNHAHRINTVRQKWDSKSITSCLCAQTTLILHAPAVTETDSISELTSSDLHSGKKSQE